MRMSSNSSSLVSCNGAVIFDPGGESNWLVLRQSTTLTAIPPNEPHLL